MEQTEIVNYGEAQKKIEEAQNLSPWWNEKSGKHEITILSEMDRLPDKLDKDTQEVRKQVKLLIDVKGAKYAWSMGVGATKASLYGQLIDYAVKNGNKLTGAKLTVVIKSDGKKRDFTIV
jgi:hypothetical protein